jgi:7-cyano-7-deazaguanine reductase
VVVIIPVVKISRIIFHIRNRIGTIGNKLNHGAIKYSMFKDKMTLLEHAKKNKTLPSIETFPCPYKGGTNAPGVIRIVFPEFTCVCPKTGYPDFASIGLFYVPDKRCVELKSWKLYLNSFRMIGTFHETVTAHLFETIQTLLKPTWLLIAGDFFPRGNVSTTIIFESGKRPAAADFLVDRYTSRAKGFKNSGKRR